MNDVDNITVPVTVSVNRQYWRHFLPPANEIA